MIQQMENRVLSAVILMKDLKDSLKPDSREAINRSQMLQTQEQAQTVMTLLIDILPHSIVLQHLAALSDLIDAAVKNDSTFVETSSQLKEMTLKLVDDALTQLCVEAGAFYKVEEFSDSHAIKHSAYLRLIVDTCADVGKPIIVED